MSLADNAIATQTNYIRGVRHLIITLDKEWTINEGRSLWRKPAHYLKSYVKILGYFPAETIIESYKAKGEPLSTRGIQHIVREIAKRIGIKKRIHAVDCTSKCDDTQR